MSAAILPPRLMARVVINEESGCWEFQGGLAKGYGRIVWEHQFWQTHRLAYTLAVGPIPDGLQIDHLCHNTTCCNPTHLEPVTQQENLRRSFAHLVATGQKTIASVNGPKTHCPQGHPYDEENTRFYNSERRCRACQRHHQAKWEQRKAGVAQ